MITTFCAKVGTVVCFFVVVFLLYVIVPFLCTNLDLASFESKSDDRPVSESQLVCINRFVAGSDLTDC